MCALPAGGGASSAGGWAVQFGTSFPLAPVIVQTRLISVIENQQVAEKILRHLRSRLTPSATGRPKSHSSRDNITSSPTRPTPIKRCRHRRRATSSSSARGRAHHCPSREIFSATSRFSITEIGPKKGFAIPKAENVRSVGARQRSAVFRQYVGWPESFWGRHLARQ